MTETIRINSATSLLKAQRLIADMWEEHKYVEVEIKQKAGQRTGQQRKAIEVYCNELAKALNDAGLDQRKVMEHMREGVEIPWQQETCKDVLWREVQKAAIGKVSTTKLSTNEVSKVYEILNRWTAQTFGVSVPFPERERQL